MAAAPKRLAAARSRGFTLIELLVVITIIGILMGLLLPVLFQIRLKTQRSVCMNNQRQVGQAVLLYATAKGSYPSNGGLAPDQEEDGVRWSWVPRLMPQLGRNDIYQELLDDPKVSNHQVTIDLLQCPADRPAKRTDPQLSYAVNGGKLDKETEPYDNIAHGLFFREQKVSLAYVVGNDGVSTTIVLSENVDLGNWNVDDIAEQNNAILWFDKEPEGKGLNQGIGGMLEPTSARPSSRHNRQFVTTFADGHIRALSQDMDYEVYQLLMTPNGRKADPPQTRALKESDLQ